MTDALAQTIASMSALNVELADCQIGSEQSVLDAIAAVYVRLASVPESVLQDVIFYNEDEIDAAASERSKGYDETGITIDLDAGRVLRDAVVTLRALEHLLAETETSLFGDPNTEWRTSDKTHFVVRGLGPAGETRGRPFLRRALKRHRVIPTEIDGLAVRLYRANLLRDAGRHDAVVRKGSVRRYGAALFPGLTIATTAIGDTFVAEPLVGIDASGMIKAHIGLAGQEDCRVIVWPELTVEPQSVRQITGILQDLALGGINFDFVLAGTWHRLLDGKMRNAGEILDGGGDHLCFVVKWAKYAVAGKPEAIEPGEEIPILVEEDRLVVFAVCRDFLSDQKEAPYCQLNVDIAIVPSMGDANSMNGHAATANTMRVRFGTRTLVVQQPEVPSGSEVGFVLNFPDAPLAGAFGTSVGGNWATCAPVEKP